jgi:hypothetical protein
MYVESNIIGFKQKNMNEQGMFLRFRTFVENNINLYDSTQEIVNSKIVECILEEQSV